MSENGWVIQEFTRLKDKNGTPIFEGDIVRYTKIKYTDCSCTEIQSVAPPIVGEIYYSDGIWLGMRNSEIGQLFMPNTITSEEFEVIGNIYENPELLEVKN